MRAPRRHAVVIFFSAKTRNIRYIMFFLSYAGVEYAQGRICNILAWIPPDVISTGITHFSS